MAKNLFNRFPAAVIIMILVIVLCCMWGHSRVSVPEQEPAEQTAANDGRRAGESNLNYYLRWLRDDGEMFTLNTADTIARRNLRLDVTYGSVVAIQTVSYLNGKDIESFARSRAEDMELSGRDILLLLDTDTKDWYVLYGSGLQPYAEASTDLRDLFRGQLTEDFFENGSNQKVLLLFNALDNWFAANVPAVEQSAGVAVGGVESATFHDVFTGILFTLLTNIWWILLLLVILTLLDRARLRHYALAHPQGYDPAEPFRPLLFWHHSDSRWFSDMMDLAELEREALEDAAEDEEPGEEQAT